MAGDDQDAIFHDNVCSPKRWCGKFLRMRILHLAFVPVALFHKSHRKSYDSVDVKVTYTLLGCTAALELMTIFLSLLSFVTSMVCGFPWPDRVAQYNLIEVPRPEQEAPVARPAGTTSTTSGA